MFVFLNNLSIDQLEGAKAVVNWLFIAATAGVWLGVYLENEKFSEPVKSKGWRLLVICLAVETLFTVAIFQIDSEIGARQKAEIIALEERLAARSLSDSQIADIVQQISPFAGQEFAIVTYRNNPESIRLATRIFEALTMAQWSHKPYGGIMLGVEAGVGTLFDDRAPRMKEASDALVGALNRNGISAASGGVTPPPNESINPRMTINVGIKP